MGKSFADRRRAKDKQEGNRLGKVELRVRKSERRGESVGKLISRERRRAGGGKNDRANRLGVGTTQSYSKLPN